MSTPSVGPKAEENTTSWLGQSNGVIDLVGRLVSIHQHQQQQALQQLQGTIQLQQAGFPVDPKSFSKLVKKSKLPIATDPETLKAWLSSQMDAKAGKDTSSGRQDQAQGQQGGGQQMQAPDGASPSHQKAVELANRIQKGEKIDPGEIFKLKVDSLAEQALRVSNKNAATEEAKADNALTVEHLKARIGAGDKEAVGRIMGMGGIPLNVEFEQWSEMPENLKQDTFLMKSGHESQSEKIQRGQGIGENLLSSGRVTDPEAAMKIGNTLANGGSLTPELKSNIKPFTFSELGQQAQLADTGINLGVPPGKLGKFLQDAAHGGIFNALPKGMQPLAIRQLGVEQERLGLEKQRVGIEGLRFAKEVEVAARATAAEQRRGVTEQQKADIEQFKTFVEMKKAGIPITDDIIKGAQDKAARALNLSAEETSTLWDYLTYGVEQAVTAGAMGTLGKSGKSYKPTGTKEGDETVDKLSGKANKTPKQSDFQKVLDAVRGKKKDSI